MVDLTYFHQRAPTSAKKTCLSMCPTTSTSSDEFDDAVPDQDIALGVPSYIKAKLFVNRTKLIDLVGFEGWTRQNVTFKTNDYVAGRWSEINGPDADKYSAQKSTTAPETTLSLLTSKYIESHKAN